MKSIIGMAVHNRLRDLLTNLMIQTEENQFSASSSVLALESKIFTTECTQAHALKGGEANPTTHFPPICSLFLNLLMVDGV